MLPLWSTQIRREKEEELIFRGLQYAEAIRLFQARFQRFPTNLKELIDVHPRCIRQLWKDPMTEDGRWALIIQGQGAPLPPSVGQPGGGPNPAGAAGQGSAAPSEGNGTDSSGGGQGAGQPPEVVTTGPIVGVRSRSTRKSIETWNGQQEYDQWLFTYALLNVRGGRPGGRPPLDARWIGRPFPGLPQPPGFQPAVQAPSGPGGGSGGSTTAPPPGPQK
jgi:hypothetical protein